MLDMEWLSNLILTNLLFVAVSTLIKLMCLMEKKQKYSINGNAISYKAEKSNTYITGVPGTYYKLSPTAHAYVSAKYFDSSDNIDGWIDRAG